MPWSSSASLSMALFGKTGAAEGYNYFLLTLSCTCLRVHCGCHTASVQEHRQCMKTKYAFGHVFLVVDVGGLGQENLNKHSLHWSHVFDRK